MNVRRRQGATTCIYLQASRQAKQHKAGTRLQLFKALCKSIGIALGLLCCTWICPELIIAYQKINIEVQLSLNAHHDYA